MSRNTSAAAPVCSFCGFVVVLGEQTQDITFASTGFTVPTVHVWRCKESLYPVC